MIKNQSFNWDEAYDLDVYLQKNYAAPRADDLEVLALYTTFWQKIAPQVKIAADVGTGPNITNLLVASQFCNTLVSYEFSKKFYAYLGETLAQDSVPPFWQPWLPHLQGLTRQPSSRKIWQNLQNACQLEQASIYTLPQNTFDAISSFYCAEGITEDLAEFNAGCRSLVGALKPGGHYFAAFVENSEKCEYPYFSPVCKVDQVKIRHTFEEISRVSACHKIEINPASFRPGYTGFVVIEGTKA